MVAPASLDVEPAALGYGLQQGGLAASVLPHEEGHPRPELEIEFAERRDVERMTGGVNFLREEGDPPKERS